jgi:transcriptional regulator with XRE-family HTH domain
MARALATRDARVMTTHPLQRAPSPPSFGVELREARNRRGLSQLELALRARSTARHLSFLETGRSRPSAEMVLRLARCLDLPLRQRNRLLRAAGHPPAFPERGLDDAALGPVVAVVDRLLEAHEPFPAYVIDARWRFLRGNRGGAWMWQAMGVTDLDSNLLLSMFSGPGAAALENRDELLWHAIELVERDALATGDPRLIDDLAALRRLANGIAPPVHAAAPVVAYRLRVGDQPVQLLTTVCRLGNANDVTVDELRVELIFPADDASEAVLRALGGAG